MKIEVNCSSCQSLLRVDAEHQGKQLRCPVCQQLSFIPGSEQPTASPDEDSFAAPLDNSPPESYPRSQFTRQRNQRAGGNPQSSALSTSLILGIIGIVLNMGCGGCLFPLLFLMNGYGLFLAITNPGPMQQACLILNIIAMSFSGFWILMMMIS